MSCKYDGRRKAYQITVEQFEELTRDLVEQTAEITKRMLSDNNMGWAHVDVVLTTGGASRMPMIRNRMKQLSGRTLNTSLSPDLSIAHGATYYAGMLMSNDKFAKSILSKEASRRLASLKQRSVNARALGVLVKNPRTGNRVPHYFLPANTPLPADATHSYGTVIPNQKRVHLQIVESGTAPGQPPVILGSCVIHDLPPNLPEGSEIAVTISYDAQAKVHVSAKDVASGKRASTEIVRQENVVPQLGSDHSGKDDLQLTPKDAEAAPADEKPGAGPAAMRQLPGSRPARTPSAEPAAARAPARPRPVQPAETPGVPKPRAIPPAKTAPMTSAAAASIAKLEKADQPVPLCNNCGEPLNSRGQCTSCGVSAAPAAQRSTGQRPTQPQTAGVQNRQQRRPAPQQPGPTSGARRPVPVPPPDDAEILELGQASAPRPRKPATAPPPRQRPQAKQPPPRKSKESGEDEFWQLVD
jgi:molecular chaperone DnaK